MSANLSIRSRIPHVFGMAHVSYAIYCCNILEDRDATHHIVYRDDVAIAFLNKYPTLYGYTPVAPVEHHEHGTGDFAMDEYVDLQKVVYWVAEALRQELPTERLYILSLGSQQGNRHVHWHIGPLPPGVPLEQQQFEALMLTDKGYLGNIRCRAQRACG